LPFSSLANVLSFLVFLGLYHLGVWGRSNEVHNSYNLQSSSSPSSFQKNVFTLWLVTFITFFWSCICITIHDFHWLLSSWYLVPPLWDLSVQGKGNETHEAFTTCNHHHHCLLLMWAHSPFVTFYCASVLAFTLFLSLCHLGVNTTKPWFLH
jgi:hypothetical protein